MSKVVRVIRVIRALRVVRVIKVNLADGTHHAVGVEEVTLDSLDLSGQLLATMSASHALWVMSLSHMN